eukprot:SM000062S19869  [mRNA]  locus=s62:132542:134989:+ [translate_table: standard]
MAERARSRAARPPAAAAAPAERADSLDPVAAALGAGEAAVPEEPAAYQTPGRSAGDSASAAEPGTPPPGELGRLGGERCSVSPNSPLRLGGLVKPGDGDGDADDTKAAAKDEAEAEAGAAMELVKSRLSAPLPTTHAGRRARESAASRGRMRSLIEEREEGGGRPHVQCAACRCPDRSPLAGGEKADPYDPRKRDGFLSWEDYFMAVAFLSAQRSKDPNRQAGIGYNGFPRGINDNELPWSKLARDGDCLKTKYPYVCHAELNAILNKNLLSARGQASRLYVTMFPCNDCAKLIIQLEGCNFCTGGNGGNGGAELTDRVVGGWLQAGIAEVVYSEDKKAVAKKHSVEYKASQKLLRMAGVKVWQHVPERRRLVLQLG